MHSRSVSLSVSVTLVLSTQCLGVLFIFGLYWHEPIQLAALLCIVRQVCQTDVSLFFLLIWLPVLFLFRPLLTQHGTAIVYAYTRPSGVLRNVPPQLAVLVAPGKLGERSEAQIEEILLRGRCRLRRLLAPLMVVRLTGPLQPQVVELGVDALLGGSLEAASIQAGKQGALLRRQHVEGMSPLLQAKLTALHAADGGGPLELVVDLDTQAPPRFTELCPHICLPFSRMSFNLPNL